MTIAIVLDGENPWEHYHGGGEQFLSLLYNACSTGALDHDAIRTTSATISNALEAAPATRRVSHLHSGSWINQDYKIWIGHQEDNRGWDLISHTRARLAEIAATLPSDRAQAAWDELYAAEGSDWFWWYGDDFDTDYKEEFDRLFRTHLRNVWTIAGLTPPDLLNEPICKPCGMPEADLVTSPLALLNPSIDGLVTDFFEWRGAGRVKTQPPLGAMWKAEGVLADAGWAWGAQLGDLDNDGRNELFIANGYVSGDRNKSYWYAMSKIAGANGNLFEDARTWPAIGTASLSGYERSRVLVNHGLAGWSDVAAQVGVTDEYDGRAVALVDLFNRGVLDVVVANERQPALVYKNTVAPGNHWIAFKLTGTRSNRSAIGAEVLLVAGGARQLKVVDGGSGFASQNDRRLHFGLGRTAQVDSAVIHWPSGAVQTIEHPAADRVHAVTELAR